MSPWNHSAQMLLPPIFSAPVEVVIAPVNRSCDAWTPLTKSLSAVPSKVVAMCAHVFAASGVVPAAMR